MSTPVMSALTAGITTLQGDAGNVFVAILPLAIGLASLIALTFFGWRMFRAFAHI